MGALKHPGFGFSARASGFDSHRRPPPPNNSFKPTPCRGVGHVLYATLARVRRPATGRLNSGVKPLMKFYALVILPIGTDVSDSQVIESTVATQMKPFEMWQDDLTPGKWDYYWCCTREWLEEVGVSLLDWPTALLESRYVVFPADTVTESGVTFAIVTPQPEWFRSNASYVAQDLTWPERAIEICKQFQGHHAVVAYCHG